MIGYDDYQKYPEGNVQAWYWLVQIPYSFNKKFLNIKKLIIIYINEKFLTAVEWTEMLHWEYIEDLYTYRETKPENQDVEVCAEIFYYSNDSWLILLFIKQIH